MILGVVERAEHPVAVHLELAAVQLERGGEVVRSREQGLSQARRIIAALVGEAQAAAGSAAPCAGTLASDRSSAPVTTAPTAKIAAAHQNAVT